jgi:hypothetical protein
MCMLLVVWVGGRISWVVLDLLLPLFASNLLSL